LVTTYGPDFKEVLSLACLHADVTLETGIPCSQEHTSSTYGSQASNNLVYCTSIDVQHSAYTNLQQELEQQQESEQQQELKKAARIGTTARIVLIVVSVAMR
jgi:hypothetical protein